MERPVLVFILSVALGASVASAQTSVTDKLNPLKSEQGGLQLQSVSGSVTYYPLDPASSFLTPGSSSGMDRAGVGITATLAYSRNRERTGLSIVYVPSYTAQYQASGGYNANHSLTINWRRNLTPKWTYSISGLGNIVSLSDAVFMPTTLANVASTPATLDELSGISTNNQLATILTGARPIESPAGLRLFGSRMLSTSVQTGFAYSYSSRLTFRVSVSGSRQQALQTSGQEASAQPDYLLSHGTTGSADFGMDYSLTPRTKLGFNVTTMRTVSNFQDDYTSGANVSLAHTLGPNWFLQFHGGTGIITPIRETNASPQRPQLQAGAGVGYKIGGQTFLASVDRAVGDSYGFGATSSVNATAAWNWTRPGSAWSIMSNFGQQWLTEDRGRNLNSWRFTAGLSHRIGHYASVSGQYGYLSGVDLLGTSNIQLARHMLRLSVTWIPNGGRAQL